MLFRFSILYFFARLVPGIVNFAAIILFTRLLVPDEYGQYALVVAAVGLGNALLFRWIRVALLRYLPAYEGRESVLLSTLLVSYLTLAVFSLAAGVIGWMIWQDALLGRLLLFGIVLLLCQAWFDINLQLVRARLMPVRYGVLLMSKALVGLAVGVALAYMGWGVWGPLVGVMTGAVLPAVVVYGRYWGGAQWQLFDRETAKQVLIYGMPLAVTFMLGLVVSSSDRFLLGFYMGADAAGQYAVGYDLAQQTIGLLMVVVNLAAAPLVIKALEGFGEEAARQRLVGNAVGLCVIGFPAAAGMIMVGPNISEVFLGEKFRMSAAMLIPWVAVGALLGGLKAFYFDLSFQLGKRTQQQVVVVLIAAVVNVVLNMWWIPLFGLLGAAYATVVAYGLALYLSWLLGRRIFPLPLPFDQIAKIVMATLGMVVALWIVMEQRGGWALFQQVFCGGLVYGMLLLALNVADCQSYVKHAVVRLRNHS